MALTFIGQSVASKIIENLVETGFNYLNACPAASGMQDELDQLQYALPQVKAVLTAVEEGAPAMMQNEGLGMWLWQLRDAVENSEDVLDELEYYELDKRIRDRDDKVRGNILSECKTKIDSFINRIFSDDTLKRLREAVKKLNKVIDRMGPFLQVAIGFYGPSVKRQKIEEVKNARETSSLLTESEVFGRDKERDRIVEWLIKPVDGESEGITFNVSAYSIVGMGGLGKTTLAQLIHQDERVQGYFHPIMWVCVSQDFNTAAIIRKMLKDENSGKSLDALHEDLKQKLTSNRFLLILDDVWNDDINYMTEWEKLVAPLKFGQRGSKILLTTRMGSVADMAARVMEYKRESLDLKELEESDCMSLFNKHAFRGVKPDDYKNLQPIGEQIVKKLGGCPLAINIMTVLRLSYDHLPTNLRVCFRYCSIFPQDYIFKRKKLVNMWMGSGLISQSICGGQSPEDIGREYLDLLTRKSFFTCKTEDFGDKIFKRYVMHDLLHDLAQSVSLGECIRIGGDVAGNTIPRTVRHLSIETTNLPSIEEIPNLKNLRTLVISDKEEHEHNEDYFPVFNKVIKGFKNLRLLSLRVNFKYNKLHDALDSLIHLRYLSISSNFTFHFQSLYRLYHLVVMELSFGGIPPMNIEYDGLTNLVNLRSLDVPYDVILNIPYLSKLPFIRKLKVFVVREKSGYKISELKNLRDLRDLSIRKLQNVRSSEEAKEAKLNKKEYLKSLSLHWSHWSKYRSSDVEVDEQLLENLCPHINLKRLRIKGYQGVKSPYWMTDLSLISLTLINLEDCKGWEHLPPLGGLPSLTGLHLRRLHAVKQIGCSFYGCGGGCAFPSLKNLNFRDMPNVEEWIGIDDCCMFPKLHTMEIINCPNLSGLPTLPCSLRKLHIFNVGLITLPAINENGGNNNQQKQFSDPESTTLIIENCEKLQYLPTEFFQKFNTIEVLTIINCSKLEEWIGIDDCCMFPKLHTMKITDCPNLSGLPTLPQCLNKLQIEDAGLTTLPAINENCGNNNQKQFSDRETTLIIKYCKKLQYLPTEFFQKFNTIEVLTIRNCSKLEEWIGIDDGCMFPKLQTMEISYCPNLRGIPTLPQCLNKLQIKDVRLTTLPAINENCGNKNQQEQFSALETLTIEECKKLQYLPTELFHKFNTLKALSIQNCPKWTIRGISNIQQPSILGERTIRSCGDLEVLLLCLANLASLTITGLHGVKKIDSSFFGSSRGCAFPSLEELYFDDLPNLEEWIGIDDCYMFSQLRSMKITGCPNLSGLPTLPCSLRHLYISNVGLITLPAIDENCRNNNQQEQFSALETLTIKECKKLQYLPTELFHKFNTLKALSIQNCPKWTIRGISNTQQPSILDERTIMSCGDLEVLLMCLENLTSLTISGLHAIKKIDSSFFGSRRGCAFPSLEELYFDDLPNLEEWIGIDDCYMFSKLHTMKIINCPNLSGLPTLPQCLNKLHIKDVGLSTLPAIENCGNNNQQEQFSALETLTIKRCEKLVYLPTELFQKFNTLKELSIKYCPKLTISGISDIQQPSILDEGTIGSCGDLEVLLLCSANLISLTISGLHGVKKIDSSFFGSSRGCAFPSLRYLYFDDLPNLEEWIGIDDCCMFSQLRSMKITGCPNLSRLPALPQCLNELHIKDVGLTTLPAIENCRNNNQEEHFQDLENLTIEQCDKLEYIPIESCQKFNTVKSLIIKKWPKLITRGISDIQLPSILDKLTIESCNDLEVHLLRLLPNLTSLTKLELVDCASITSLPPAQVCSLWMKLSILIIKNCKELSSFGGIQDLVSLCRLEISGCDKLIEVALRQPPFPNDVSQKNAADCLLKLGELSIDHHALLLMEPLRSLSSISSFTISDASGVTSLPEEWLLQNHAALKYLHIWNACSLQSLPQSMTQLCSLKSLDVTNAKLIQSLPDLPTSLHSLEISGCHPELTERCQENIGLDWPKIANIPDVEIESTYSEED